MTAIDQTPPTSIRARRRGWPGPPRTAGSTSSPRRRWRSRDRPREHGGRGRSRRPRVGDRHGRAAGQGDADRQHDPPAARRGEGGAAGRRQPAAAARHPPGLDRRAQGRPRARAGRGAGPDHPAVHRRPTPTDAELRIAQAQLVGWLEGLFHGIQTALFAQQMAARAQLEQMRRALPPGAVVQAGDEPQPQPGQRTGCTSSWSEGLRAPVSDPRATQDMSRSGWNRLGYGVSCEAC